MQRQNGTRLCSASDLVSFLECEYRTELDLRALDDRELAAKKCGDDPNAELLARRGDRHEAKYWEALRDSVSKTVDLKGQEKGVEVQVARTLEAMRSGADAIYQATLSVDGLIGHTDFLRRVETPSPLCGSWSYEVWDTKLARSPKAKFLVQLAFYSALLQRTQGVAPIQMHVVLGDGSVSAYRCADYAHYHDALLSRFSSRLASLDSGAPSGVYPLPVEHCELCHWREHCESIRIADDHLCQVAGITRGQIEKLEASGVSTLAGLAALPPTVSVPRLQPETLDKLRSQAALQDEARRTGKRKAILLATDPQGRRGFHRMPSPDPGDLFFDMEGDPLEEDGLEYLLGVWLRDRGKWTYRAFWAHTRTEERAAFEAFMDFVTEHRRSFPGAHIYHYASYEETALKRLACLHATRESELDDLLRNDVLVDLYKVVREAVRISEPSYSIKNVEHFYRDARKGEVQNAGTSLVYYERWRESGDAGVLDAIEGYNRDDTESTQQLRDWLLTLRPPEVPWLTAGRDASDIEAPKSDFVRQIEERLAKYRSALVDALPSDQSTLTAEQHTSELTYQLLDFHRRAAKPAWWALFTRMDASEEELLEDPECLAGLDADQGCPPEQIKRSTQYTYIAPEQESKLVVGDQCTRCDTGESLGTIQLFDEATRRVKLKIGAKRPALPTRLSIGPGRPLDTEVITDAIFRFADALLHGEGRYSAIEDLLARRQPRLRGWACGDPIVPEGADQLQASIAAVSALDRSYLYVQGPPGAGKTYTGSRRIAALLGLGKTVGIMSNSHKAINLIMAESIRVALKAGVDVRAFKKANAARYETELDEPDVPVQNVYQNADIWDSEANLIGGTAWLFSDEEIDQGLDYLFVDEAGQVALANLVGAGTAASNIVLLGDQMQLGQPIQGVHPGHSGESALHYLLDGAATIRPDRGIFLATSWRMHPDVCRFISDAIYDGRLVAEARNRKRMLILREKAHPLLRSSGVVYAPVEHAGCSQRSEEEAQLIAQIFDSALEQKYTDEHGVEHQIGPDNILVVAPYNLQVNLLRKALPDGARVGTVDKFQGQEAELVLVSMTTSSEQDLPRHIEFLYSKNRLNVAVSRAKCVAIVVANPALLAIKCRTPEQMALVNTMCWLAETGSRVSSST